MRSIFTFLSLFLIQTGFSQSVGIGTAAPDSSAALDIRSVTKGILIPRMGRTTMYGIVRPAKGLLIYDSVQNQLWANMGEPDAPSWNEMTVNSAWGINGNAGTHISQFIGTLDDQPLSFRVRGIVSGFIDNRRQNTCFGLSALESTINGIGTATGLDGVSNTALGTAALEDNTTGSYNIALGSLALEANTTGVENAALGSSALFFNTTGSDNCALGNSSLFNNIDGAGNTVAGSVSLTSTTNSSYNTVVGYNSANKFNNGYNNVFVGANCDVTGAGYFNVIAIGQGVTCTASSQARFGNSATNSIGGYANWTNFSDGRYKKNMQENVKGIDFIMRLRPLTYNLDVTGIQNKLGTKRPTDAGSQQAIAAKEAMVFSGFAAQEVEQAAKDAGYNFSGVDKPKNDNDFYGLRYSDFVVPLVKGMQEQQKMILQLQKKLDQQAQQINQLLNKNK
jgi:trimeric autotransporter adhesin